MKPSDSKKTAEPSAKVWGLTGGIASGKSTVARFFAEEGVPVIDADQLARELRAPGGAGHGPIVQKFGTADPAKLREIVFADSRARAELEAILHPLIREKSERLIRQIVAERASAQKTIPVIYEAALLVENGRYRDFSGLIVVSADEETRLARLLARDRNPETLARKILSAQIHDRERRAHAKFVIENHGSLEELRAQVRAIIPQLG